MRTNRTNNIGTLGRPKKYKRKDTKDLVNTKDLVKPGESTNPKGLVKPGNP